jgi:hypothetical protein
MVFYLTWFQKLDNILAYYLNNMNFVDACLVSRLFYLLNVEAKTMVLINFETATSMEILNVS